ncbi:MAG: hypothetical protein K1X51_04545 [Rhodospirillaceae bacterium]|nr:hypothetical protein [Rhodospirillaceae bacterium]
MPRAAVLIFAAALISGPLFGQQAMAESKSFVVTWFGQAMNSKDGDCGPEGPNPRWPEQRLKNARDLGYSAEEVEKMLKEDLRGDEGYEAGKIVQANVFRGRINGEAVNGYLYPSTVIDPKLRGLTGEKARFQYGFNLDGKVGDKDFEDPETHEKGVDSAFTRAMGCMPTFRGGLTPAAAPLEYAWAWAWKKEGRSAWIVTVTAGDLTRDGDATLTFDRAIERLRFNADGSPRSDSSYRIDPSPKSHNEYKARIKDGLITLADPGAADFSMVYNPEFIPVIRMTKVHIRLKVLPDRTIAGFLGGYERWDDLYIAYASGGKSNEDGNAGDLAGLYWLLRKYADHDPSPATGQMMAISATWNFYGIPAFAVKIEAPTASVHH